MFYNFDLWPLSKSTTGLVAICNSAFERNLHLLDKRNRVESEVSEVRFDFKKVLPNVVICFKHLGLVVEACTREVAYEVKILPMLSPSNKPIL